MIHHLSSPSVCVIDEDEQDYAPILEALLRLGLGCVHVKGDSIDSLPPIPFSGLRIVFTDLHLSASTGRSVTSHTASVFRRVVSPESAPVVVVIWSKYSSQPLEESGPPAEDGPTQADHFKQTVLESEPKYRGRLLFLEMAKPQVRDRPDPAEWMSQLQRDIQVELRRFEGCNVLWSWESMVRQAGNSISQEITTLALDTLPTSSETPNRATLLDQSLKKVFCRLAHEQGGPDCTAATAPRHLATILAQSLADHLEHSTMVELLSAHAAWLNSENAVVETSSITARLNSLLLTASVSQGGRSFVPGTLYRLTEAEKFVTLFGVPAEELTNDCYTEARKKRGWTKEVWDSRIKHVLLELSPVCDFHQSTRRQALLIAGLIVPAEGRENAKRGDAFETFPTFRLRWQPDGGSESDVFLIFCSRYKVTLAPKQEPEWLVPWFRLRDLPTAALRNWHANHAARVGYVSLR